VSVVALLSDLVAPVLSVVALLSDLVAPVLSVVALLSNMIALRARLVAHFRSPRSSRPGSRRAIPTSGSTDQPVRTILTRLGASQPGAPG
jgi:hypothetical protein